MRIVIVGVALAVLALAACSGGEGPLAADPTVEPSPEPVAVATEQADMTGMTEETSPMLAATDDAAAVDAASPEAMATPSGIEATPPAVATHQPTTSPTFTLEFPNDVAMLASISPPPPPNETEGWPRMEPARVYREGGDGEVVMETLFSAPLPWEQECTDISPVDDSDLQTLVGQLPECSGYYILGLNAKLGLDGEPDVSSIIMSVCIKDPCTFHEVEDAENYGDLGKQAAFESTDGGVTWERIPGAGLSGTRTVALTFPDGRWLVSGGNWPLDIPNEVLEGYHEFIPIALQIGPFLRVTGMGEGCLPIRADPSPDTEELACVAERVLLQDQGGDVITDDGVTWRKVKTPAGVVGWADGRYLE